MWPNTLVKVRFVLVRPQVPKLKKWSVNLTPENAKALWHFKINEILFQKPSDETSFYSVVHGKMNGFAEDWIK